MSEFSNVKHVLETKFETEFPASTYHTSWDNAISEGQPDDALWCRVSVTLGSDSQVTNGHPTARHRMTGVMTVQILTPINSGTKGANDFADLIVKQFRSRTIGSGTLASPYVHFRQNPTIKVIGKVGKFWQQNVICPWYSDASRTAIT